LAGCCECGDEQSGSGATELAVYSVVIGQQTSVLGQSSFKLSSYFNGPFTRFEHVAGFISNKT
jgi:hypothetical protein